MIRFVLNMASLHASEQPRARKRRNKMRLFSATVISLSLIASAIAHAQAQAAAGSGVGPTSSLQGSQTIRISRSGSQPSSNGPVEHFTGSIRIEPLFSVHDPSRAVGASVTFEPGARTAWHTHPLGQILIATAGSGWIQQWGGPVEEIRKGDVVWISAGTKHWHGATPNTTMTHIAIEEQLNGKVVEWLEKVSDEQYQKR
jgi:quercetin dioxygenase-like cupin family protein